MMSLICAVFAVALSCSSRSNRTGETYDDLAAAINPALAKLRPIIAPMLAPDVLQADAHQIIAACLSAEADLIPLRDVDFKDTARLLGTGDADAHMIITALLQHRPGKVPDRER